MHSPPARPVILALAALALALPVVGALCAAVGVLSAIGWP